MSKVMNLAKKLKQKIVLERISEIKWQDYSSRPFIVELDPTAVCDLACPGCISEDLIKVGNSFSNERILSLCEEMIEIGVKGVILIGGGEPLAHPMAGKIISSLGANDVHIGITTNGSFINRWINEIAEFSSWTRVSMDAANSEVFGVNRPTKGGKSKFEKIIKNMESLAAIKKGKMGFSFLIQTKADGNGVVSNIHQIYDAAKLAKDIGCDYFEVKPSYEFREGIDHALMKHSEKDTTFAMSEVARLDELESDNFKILKAINLEHSFDKAFGINQIQLKTYKECPSAYLRTTITPSGGYVCPYWRGKEWAKFGDFSVSSFKDIWFSKKRHEVMQKLNPSKDCNFHCLRDQTNLDIMRLHELLANNQVENIEEEFDRFI